MCKLRKLKGKNLCESFLNFYVLVERKQELHVSCSLLESFLNYHVLVEREQELREN